MDKPATTDPRVPDAASARGRDARGVWDIPLVGWRDIVHRVVKRLDDHRIYLVSGGVAFFLILSIFPALGMVVSLYGLLADPSVIAGQMENLGGVLPEEAIALLERHLSRLIAQDNTQLGLAFLASLAITFWFANTGLKALFMALNVVYDEREKRNIIRFNLASFKAAAALLFVVLLMIGLTVAAPMVLDRLGLDAIIGLAVSLMRWPVVLLAASLALMIVYRIGPSRRPPRWRWIAWGSLATAIAWLVASGIFSIYLSHFANYDVTYGSLGAVIGFMLWTYVSVFVTLTGAELNAEIEHQLVTDTTVGTDRPLGARGAYKADHVDPAAGRRRRSRGAD